MMTTTMPETILAAAPGITAFVARVREADNGSLIGILAVTRRCP